MSKKKRKKKSDTAVPAASSPDRQAGGTTGDEQTDADAPPRGDVQTSAAAGGRSAPIGVADPALRALEREQALRKAAYELFLAEGGADLEALMENGQCTARAYTSQIRAAEEGGQGWGPTVTPYEDRMTRSLQFRLIRERRKWIEDCRKRIEAAMEEASDAAVSPGRQAVGTTGDEQTDANANTCGEQSPMVGAGGCFATIAFGDPALDDIDKITETGERLAEGARAETAIMEEAVAMARAEYERDKGRILPVSGGVASPSGTRAAP